MGGNQSVNQNNVQTVNNKISQISNEQCINLCLNEGDISVKIIDADVGNILIKKGCAINSASCVLKASLDTELINDLSSTQDASQSEMEGPFTLLTELLGGGNQTVNQNNFQAISNESSQQMNSLCHTYAISDNPIVVDIEQSKVKNLNINNMDQINKSKCVINNMSKFYAQNSEVNKQKAHQAQAGIFALIIIAIVIIAVVFLATRHKKQKDHDLSKALEGGVDIVKSAMGNDSDKKTPTPTAPPAAPPPSYDQSVIDTILSTPS